MIERALKYVSIIVACVTALVILHRFRGCSFNQDTPQSTTVASDSSFAPVTRKDYQLPSLPFSPKRLGVALPRGISEGDVKRIVTLEVTGVPNPQVKRIDIVETVEGGVFVERDSSIKSVTVTAVEPRAVSFGVRFGCGLSASRAGSPIAVSPAAVFAPVEWSGWIHAPTIVADLDGFGPGAQVQLYHDLYLGAARLWLYQNGTSAKLTLAYMF